MNRTAIGIGNMGIYVPHKAIEVNRIVELRSKQQPESKSRMEKAYKAMGQESFRFPEVCEDTASMAANAASTILEGLKNDEQSKIRYMSVGTETAIDHAKPVTSHVHGMLMEAGYSLRHSLLTVELKHACAGGTVAILSNAAMLNISSDSEERALCICSDVARYETPGTAELTQGAGSVALLLEKNPQLLELNLVNQGFYSSDVDDFFRPLDSITPKLQGAYSIRCYNYAIENAFMDYCNRLNSNPHKVIGNTDYAVLHIPFTKMPEIAINHLLKTTCRMDYKAIEKFKARIYFREAMNLNKSLGNLYTSSMYVYLMNLLDQQYKILGSGIVGKKILLASYGSGNTMIVFDAIIAPGAPKVIKSWNLDKIKNHFHRANFDEYQNWIDFSLMSTSQLRDTLNNTRAPTSPGLFYLQGLRDNDARIYSRVKT